MQGRGLKKRAGALATTTPELVRMLDQLSKAALIDIAADLMALAEGYADDPVAPARAMDYIEPVLIARGDRRPKI